MKLNELHKEADAVAMAFVVMAGLPLAVFVALRGHYVIAAIAALMGAVGLWIVVAAVRHAVRVNAARRTQALPPAAVAAVTAQIGPPPAVIRVAAWSCYLIAAAATALAAVFAAAIGVRDPLANVAGVLVVVVLLVAAGLVISGRRLTRQGDPYSLYAFAGGLAMISLGAVVYGVDTYGLTRWGELVGYGIATAVLIGLSCLPAVGPGARWLRRHRAVAAAYRTGRTDSTVD